MNEDIKNKLISIMSNAEQFMADEMPLFAKEAINWYFACSVVSIVISLVILCVGIAILRNGIACCEEDKKNKLHEPRPVTVFA